MKKQAKLYRSVMVVAIVTVLLLMVPLVAMQFTREVDWKLPDFMIMGILIFGTGLSLVLLLRCAPNFAYRLAMVLALATTFLMIWANLAVGLIGSGANAGNIMFAAVVFIVIAGSLLSGFKAAGMELVMYTASFSLVLLAIVALLIGVQHYPGSSTIEVLGVSGFFAGLYLVAGALFRYAATHTLSRQAV
jgi:hypothetical protein